MTHKNYYCFLKNKQTDTIHIVNVKEGSDKRWVLSSNSSICNHESISNEDLIKKAITFKCSVNVITKMSDIEVANVLMDHENGAYSEEDVTFMSSILQDEGNNVCANCVKHFFKNA